MKKQVCLAALCLLAVAGGCAKIPETEPGGNTRENAATAAMPVDGENHLYTLSAETPQGLYNIKGGRRAVFPGLCRRRKSPLVYRAGLYPYGGRLRSLPAGGHLWYVFVSAGGRFPGIRSAGR